MMCSLTSRSFMYFFPSDFLGYSHAAPSLHFLDKQPIFSYLSTQKVLASFFSVILNNPQDGSSGALPNSSQVSFPHHTLSPTTTLHFLQNNQYDFKLFIWVLRFVSSSRDLCGDGIEEQNCSHSLANQDFPDYVVNGELSIIFSQSILHISRFANE